MFLRRSSLEDDVICSLSLVPLALLLTLFVFSLFFAFFFFFLANADTHVVQHNDTLRPCFFLQVERRRRLQDRERGGGMMR